MLYSVDLLYIFGPALLIASLTLFIISIRRRRNGGSELSEAIDHFKLTSIVFGGLVVVLWLSLPSVPSLKTFGYPESVSVIKEDAKVLYLFQEYNRAIVRTTEVLQWFLFLFVWWFLATLYGVGRAYKYRSGKAIST